MHRRYDPTASTYWLEARPTLGSVLDPLRFLPLLAVVEGPLQ
jgi:hypothetical protein